MDHRAKNMLALAGGLVNVRARVSAPGGRVNISCAEEGTNIVINWVESGGPPVKRRQKEGFGSLLVRTTVSGQFRGRESYDWKSEGVAIHLSIPKERLA